MKVARHRILVPSASVVKLSNGEKISFLNDNQHSISLLYRHNVDEEDKPIEICPIPLPFDTQFFGDVVLKALQVLHTKDTNFVQMMNDSQTFRTLINYIGNENNTIYLYLTMTNLSNGDSIEEDTKTEPYYFFNKDSDYLQDVFYEPLNTLVKEYDELNYTKQSRMNEEIVTWIDDKINEVIVKQLKTVGELTDADDIEFNTVYNCNFVLPKDEEKEERQINELIHIKVSISYQNN